MIKSLFIQFIDKYFAGIVGKITELFNGKSKEPTYLHKTMLTTEYSPSLTWGSTQLNHSVVSADIVSLGSSLPLKSRGSMGVATGNLPKMGMKYFKDEKDISDINVMIARGTDEATIATKLFDDAANAIKGIDILNECLFLQGLSTGIALVDDPDRAGAGVRVNFGYKESNTFHATTAPWANSEGKLNNDATPIDDIRQMFDKADADSNVINHVWLSKKYCDLARKSTQGKELVAGYTNLVYTDVANLPVPNNSVFLEALKDEFGAAFHVINATFKYQSASGSHNPIKPWEVANIIGTPSDNVGRLVYGTLAEETNPVEGVTYTKSGLYTLVSKYAQPDPLREFTCSQAICLPVIDGAEGIYILHADSTDASTLSVSPSELNFTDKKATKYASVHYDGAVSDLAVDCTADWATVTLNDKKVKIAVTANDGEERTTSATVSAGNATTIITITQEGTEDTDTGDENQ